MSVISAENKKIHTIIGLSSNSITYLLEDKAVVNITSHPRKFLNQKKNARYATVQQRHQISWRLTSASINSAASASSTTLTPLLTPERLGSSCVLSMSAASRLNTYCCKDYYQRNNFKNITNTYKTWK